MTIFYLDPEGGNDSNDGLSFANRWKTLVGGPTAARTAPGDTIRVMASRPANNVGLGTWTDKAVDLTLARKVTLATPTWLIVDDADSGWVGVTNVTVTNPTGNGQDGGNSMQAVIASAFTTGKLAYKTLAAATDFSAFQQLCFYVLASTTPVTVTMEIALCSDTLGDVPVDVLPFDLSTGLVINTWAAVLADKGSALSAGINSIAIYATVDPHVSQSKTLRFDNFVACKGPNDALCVTNRSIFGKNTVGEPEWYHVKGIGSDHLKVGVLNSTPYMGVTETVDTWIINPTTAWSSAERTINEGGSPVLPITYSGGWNRTDMSTKVGHTWVTGWGFNTELFANASKPNIVMEDIGAVMFTGAAFPLYGGWKVRSPGVLGCVNTFTNFNMTVGQPQYVSFECDQIWQSGQVGVGVNNGYKIKIGKLHGYINSSVIGAMKLTEYTRGLDQVIVKRFENNSVNLQTVSGVFELRGASLDAFPQLSMNHGNFYIDGCDGTFPADFDGSSGALHQTRIGGNANLHRTDIPGAAFFSQNSTTHTPGYAWTMTVDYSWSSGVGASYYSDLSPARFTLASFTVEADKLVTVKCWVMRASTELQAGLEFRENELPGVALTQVIAAGPIDTWEELTITCTPTGAGVLTVHAIGYVIATANRTDVTGHFDDISVEQAA